MRKNPSHVRIQYIAIPRQIYGHKQMIILVAGLIFVNGLALILTASQKIALLTVEYVKIRTAKRLAEAMKNVVQIYISRGFVFTMGILDKQFYLLRSKIGAVDMSINSSAEHAPEFERLSITVKELVGTIKIYLPYIFFPWRVIIELITFCIFLNYFPNNNSASHWYRPQNNMAGTLLDFTKNFKL